MDDRRHRVNPGRTPHQRRRNHGSHEYLRGWAQGWSDARRGRTKPIPRQSGGRGGKPPKKSFLAELLGCLLMVAMLPLWPVFVAVHYAGAAIPSRRLRGCAGRNGAGPITGRAGTHTLRPGRATTAGWWSA